MLRSILQNSTAGFYIFASDSTTPTSGKTGLTITTTLSKAGGTANSVSPTITEIGNGLYWVAPIAAHRDTLGEIAWQFSGTGAIIAPRLEKVVAVNDQAARFGASDGTGVTLAADQAVNVTKVNGTSQTAGDLAALLTTLSSYVDTEVAAIKAKTDNLPSDPADQSAVEAAITGIKSLGHFVVTRSPADTNAITFAWPVSGATITGQRSLNNGSYSAVSGSIAFLRTESSKHYYTLSYNASDRPATEGQVRYKFDDGTYTRYVVVRVSETVPTAGQNADAVWDEVLTGATHNIAGSAGRRLRQLASVIVHSGTAQGPGADGNQIQLDAGASSINGAYDPGLIYIENGTGAGQARLILQYNGSTKIATVDRDWRINPDNTSEFVIIGDAGRESVNEGLAQAATATTITLNANASSNDDAYNGQLVFIRSGLGQDQVALVEDYVGSTKVATIRTHRSNGQWAVTPDTTSAYVMLPNLTWTISEIQNGLATASQLTTVESKIDTLDDYVDTEVAAIKAKTDNLPSDPADQSAVEAAIIAAIATLPTSEVIADAVWNEEMAGHTTAGTYGGRIVRASNSNVTVQITGSNHVAADVHEFQTDTINANAIAASAVAEIQSGLATASQLTTECLEIKDRQGYTLAILAGSISNAGSPTETYVIDIGDIYTVAYSGLTSLGNRGGASLNKV